jgi:hypothetical protein
MISPDIIVAAGLRWLGGDDMKAIEDTFHISLPSAQRIVNRFLDAMIDCGHEDCEIELPSDDELEALAEEWSKLSTAGGSMNGCVLAIDGFLSPRTKPMSTIQMNSSQTERASTASTSSPLLIIWAGSDTSPLLLREEPMISDHTGAQRN